MYESSVEKLQAALQDTDRRKQYQGHPNLLVGQCYVACEVMKALHPELRPQVMSVGPNGLDEAPYGTHWFLRDEQGNVVDPTAGQFTHTPVYSIGRGCGFLTKTPSKRAVAVLQRLEA